MRRAESVVEDALLLALAPAAEVVEVVRTAVLRDIYPTCDEGRWRTGPSSTESTDTGRQPSTTTLNEDSPTR